MVGYTIFFDESNKIDDRTKQYSFYGALGVTEKVRYELDMNKAAIQEKLGSHGELHFCKYDSDFSLKKYYQILDMALKSDFRLNVIAVLNQRAMQFTDALGITADELKDMMYIKIPERLFYGLARYIPTKKSIVKTQIFIDECSEYGKILLNERVRSQLNAQAVYRNLKYFIEEIRDEDSANCNLLQITDCLLGIASYLIGASYANASKKTMVKDELIYCLLNTEGNLELFQDKVKVFLWNGSGQLLEVPLSRYLNSFFRHKSNFDRRELMRLASLRRDHADKDLKFYRQEMGYNSNSDNMVKGYLASMEGKDRLELLMSE